MLTLNKPLAQLVTLIVQTCRTAGLKESVVRRVLTEHSNAHSEQAAHLLSRRNTLKSAPNEIWTVDDWFKTDLLGPIRLAPHLQMTCTEGCDLPVRFEPLRAFIAHQRTIDKDENEIHIACSPTLLCPRCHSPLELYDIEKDTTVDGSAMQPVRISI